MIVTEKKKPVKTQTPTVEKANAERKAAGKDALPPREGSTSTSEKGAAGALLADLSKQTKEQSAIIDAMIEQNQVLLGIVKNDVPVTVAYTIAAMIAADKMPEACETKLPKFAKIAWQAHEAVNSHLPIMDAEVKGVG